VFPYFFLTETPDSSTTSTGSSSPSENFSSVQQSLNSLRSLSNHFSDLTLACGKLRRGQFRYISETEASTTPLSPSTLSRTNSYSLFDQQPRNLFTPDTSPLPITIHISDNSDDSDDEMPPAIFFWGDNRADDPVPGNFLKLISSGFKESSSDTFKAKQLENGFATNSVAELWFDALSAATKADWDRLEAVFKVRWPKEVIVPPTIEQRHSQLRAEKLAKEDIGVIVMVNGVEMTGQARWASKVLALSALVEDPTGASIHSV
jgi:hypothetical protein